MTYLNVEDDFKAIADALETVTLKRRGSNEAVKVEMACRERVHESEAVPSSAGVLQSDCSWHLQLPAEVASPEPGDVIVDEQKNRWTLLEVERLTKLDRYRCLTRELRLAHGCINRVDVERAVWDDLGNGPEIVDWFHVCLALPVKIQLDEMILDTSTVPPTKQLLFDIVLSESVPLEPDDRLTAEDGVSYRLQSLQQAERIDTLPIANVIREA